MSFRHTYVTEFLYKETKKEEIAEIEKILEEYGIVTWSGGYTPGNKNMGYFHGIIKDSNGYDTKEKEQEIVDRLAKLDVRIKIIFE